MRLLRPFGILATLLLVAPTAFSQIRHVPKCTIAAGSAQVHTEGGDCGLDEQGQMVILTDGTSKTDCGQTCGGSSGGGNIPSLCAYNATAACLESVGGLPANPASCTGVNFAKDQDETGVLTCQDPLSGRTVDALPDVNGKLGTTGYIRFSVSEDGVTGNGVCFDANDNLTDCGVTPTGGGDVEDMDTSMAAGEGVLSDGAGNLVETDLASQAELDAAVTFAEAFQGEAAILEDLSSPSPAFDFSAETDFMLPNVWETEGLDEAGHWRARAQGSNSSNNWRNDDLMCWYPPHTYYVYVADHCSGGSAPDYAYSEGRPCTTAANCQDASETCDAEEWDASQTPDRITITAHDFGPAASIYAETVGIERPNGAPVHGSSSTAIQCTPGNLIADKRYWIYVEDANTIIPYQDDGDGVAELGSGTPPSGGDDEAMNCTNFQEWQGVTIFPQNQSDGSKITHALNAEATQNYYLSDSTGQDLQCVGGTNHGTTCDTEWEQGDQCTGTPAGVCMEVTTPNDVAVGFAYTFPEGVDESFANWGLSSQKTLTRHNSYAGTTLAGLLYDFSPGYCIGLIGHPTTTNNDLDTVGVYGASISVMEARRAAPQRVPCDFASNSVVGAACLYYGHLTNRGSNANVELDLPPLTEGMDFLVSNQTTGGYSMWIDPDGTERFESPATTDDGDRLRSDVAGDTLRIYVPEDGKARVIFNSGGWYDDD